ncbi:PspC domain-containing protein [Nocardioides mangrovicus]|uniref:PspC domain-containing protein n=1 Tax=Nocardioides mangrovicus TaxID=2478913 RepID=A0A3L8P178_9ACTN|nr:PspC domain-containing protein [Nocardioides mangrovicus]RLV48563.1 PspC domain-containing protein [Nocardioides mangrovicus]
MTSTHPTAEPSTQPNTQPSTGPRRLVRPRGDRMIAGVAGGWAQYLNIDATLLRVLLVLAFVFTGFFPVGIVYLVAWLVTPQQ